MGNLGSTDEKHSIYRQRKGDAGFKSKVPWTIYFSYVSGSIQRPVAKHYSYSRPNGPIDEAEVDAIARGLAKNATRPDPEQFPPYDTIQWDKVVWQRRSYIFIIVDIDNVKFLNKAQGGALDIIINSATTQNHTFFDAVDETNFEFVDYLGRTKNATAVCMRNHMKRDDDGVNLRAGERQHFRFRLRTDPELGDQRVIPPVYPDSGGTNLGPPIGPP